MAETESEKVVKDTLKRIDNQEDVILKQNISTTKFSSETIDFFVVDNESRSHLIEVKESAETKLYESLFKDDQVEVLSSPILNREESNTKPWIISRFYRKDVTRKSHDYFEYYFMLPGYYVQQDPSIDQIRGAGDTHYLGGMKNGEREFIDDTYGISTQENESKGLPLLREVLI